MFKFSAVSQIWKKYIQKLNDWDLPLNSKLTTLFGNLSPDFTLAMQVMCKQHGATEGLFMKRKEINNK